MEKLRAYQIDGHYYPSVTSIISFGLGFPEGMLDWVARNSALRALREKRKSDKEGMKLTQKELVAIAMTERTRLLTEAQDKGKTVHGWIEDYFNSNPPTNTEKYQGYWDSFKKWHSYFPAIPILQEEVVFDHEYKYAGRIDFYGELNGKRVLIDFKTSNFLKHEYGIQLTAYKKCLEQMGYPVDACYILRLTSGGFYEFVEFNEPFELFVSVRKFFSWKVSVENPEFDLSCSMMSEY